MENATEALLIAGGILLGILTITAFVYMFSNVAIIKNAENDKIELERLKEWNGEWESYNKNYLYGTEVLTVINKAEQNNLDNNDTIEIKVFKSDVGELDKEYIKLVYKNNIFTCTDIKYSQTTGKVNSMFFEYVE